MDGYLLCFFICLDWLLSSEAKKKEILTNCSLSIRCIDGWITPYLKLLSTGCSLLSLEGSRKKDDLQSTQFNSFLKKIVWVLHFIIFQKFE